MYPSLQHRPRCPAIMNSFIVEDYASQLHGGLFWNPVSYNSTMEDNFRVFERTRTADLSIGVSISELRNLWTNGMPLVLAKNGVPSVEDGGWITWRVRSSRGLSPQKRFWMLKLLNSKLQSFMKKMRPNNQPKIQFASKNGPPVQ